MDAIARIRRHPVTTFCLLTFLITWTWILLVVAPGGFPVEPDQFGPLMLLVYPAMFVGPTLAALVVAALVDGRVGLRELAARMGHWRVAPRWYVFAVGFAPISILAVLLSLSVASASFTPLLLTSDDKAFLLFYPIVAGVATALFEELGWTGFATATLLKQRHGTVSTGLTLGVIFAAWNGLVVFWSGAGVGTLPAAVFLPIALFTWLPAYRVVATWVYKQTGSLPVAIVLWTSLWASWTSLTPAAALEGAPLAIFYAVLGGVLWLLFGAITVASRGRVAASRSLLTSSPRG